MLSGETAIGEYPVEAVAMMQRIMHETEKMFDGRSSRMTAHDKPRGWSVSDAVIFGAAQIARRVGAKMVVFASSSGDAALMKSKQRDFIPTVCITDQPVVYRRMSLYWGVKPVLTPQSMTPENLHDFIDDWAKENAGANVGDPLVIVSDTELVRGVHDTVMVTEID
jgi:pyruvate kinase